MRASGIVLVECYRTFSFSEMVIMSVLSAFNTRIALLFVALRGKKSPHEFK